jgi:hypothetical protein
MGLAACGTGGDGNADPVEPLCNHDVSSRTDQYTPASMVADWGAPVRLSDSVNTDCPQDAIEISRDGETLYVLYMEDVLGGMTPEMMLAKYNNTYRLKRTGGPTEFGERTYFDLGKGTVQSFDGELSFSPDGAKVYFHSARAENTGLQLDPPNDDDFLDIYVAELDKGVPGPGVNLGPPVNSEYPDGEQAIHPDGVTLYFASLRPSGYGGADIYTSTWDGAAWSTPANLGTTINTIFDDYQPAFNASGDTMYFASLRDPFLGMAIYRSHRVDGAWGEPELVIQGLVGEPSLTEDGEYLYFVHMLSDTESDYDTDVWVSQRVVD